MYKPTSSLDPSFEKANLHFYNIIIILQTLIDVLLRVSSSRLCAYQLCFKSCIHANVSFNLLILYISSYLPLRCKEGGGDEVTFSTLNVFCTIQYGFRSRLQTLRKPDKVIHSFVSHDLSRCSALPLS